MENLTKDEKEKFNQILEIAREVLKHIYKVLKSPPGEGQVILDVAKNGEVDIWRKFKSEGKDI